MTIKAGGTVIWVNKEKRTSHSVVLPAAQGGESERFFPHSAVQGITVFHVANEPVQNPREMLRDICNKKPRGRVDLTKNACS